MRRVDPAMRPVVVIDNYDSFVYNLVQYLRELGARTIVVRNDIVTVAEVREMRPAGIVISPGPCSPAEAGVSTELVRRLGPLVPVLGVCLGHQCIGEAYGAAVVVAPEVVHGKTSEIRHDGAGVYRGLPNPLKATRYHSLVVDPSSLPDPLFATAWTPDGVLMGVRHARHPVEGVQFHPESILTEAGHSLLRNFLDGGAAWADGVPAG